MTPVAFEGCFGSLHPASGDVGVVLCPGLGHDARTAHRALRLLADQIARAGYPALRFDYPGTGDSGDAADDDLLRAWLGSVQAAADHLRAVAGVRRVALWGLRFGATLATLATESRTDVAGVVLLAPVIVGRTYARELTAAARLARRLDALVQEQEDEGWLEADGLRPSSGTPRSLEQATLRSLERIDPRQIARPPARKVLVLEPATSSTADGFAARLESLGAEVTRSTFDGYADLLRASSVDAVEPQADFDRAVAWLRSEAPCRPGAGRSITQATDPAVLRTGTWTEEVLRLGPSGLLSGVLTRPASAEAVQDWAVIFGNSGNDPRYGNHRFQAPSRVAWPPRSASARCASTSPAWATARPRPPAPTPTLSRRTAEPIFPRQSTL